MSSQNCSSAVELPSRGGLKDFNVNSQKRNHLRSVNPRTFTLALEIPELQMTCAWGGIPGFVCLPRDPLLALVRDGCLLGPDVAVLDVLEFPGIAHK